MADFSKGSNGSSLMPDRLRALLTRADDGVWVTTVAGRIVFWNRAAEDMLGYSADDVYGRSCGEVLTECDEQGRPVCGPDCDAAGLTRGANTSFGVPTHAKDGRDVWLEVTTFRIDGGAPLVVHVFHDATGTKQLLRDLHEHLGAAAGGEARLTRREREVLRLMAGGLGTAAAAARLSVSRATIRNHVQNIFGKLGVHTRLEAVAHATRHRLV
jgi:PAS domain S-box-containing protein